MGFFLFVPSRLSRRIKHKITISPIHKQFVEIFCGLLDSYISQKKQGCVCVENLENQFQTCLELEAKLINFL